jgi:hypothetical protein
MASVIKIKRSSTASSVPSGLQEGELAVNLFDRKLYVGNSTGVTAVSGEVAIADVDGLSAALDNRMTVANTQALVNARLGATASITLTGDVSAGPTSFSGNAVSLSVTVADDSHNHVISNVDGLQDALDAKATWSALTSTNTAIRALTTANANEIGDLWSGLIATNTAIRALTSQNATNIDQKLGATATVTLTGDVTASSTAFSSNAVSISTTIADNSVALGTKTTGNYVAGVSGTANEIEVSGSGSESASVQIGLPNNVTIGNNLTVTNDLAVSGDATIDGNLTVEGALTYISSSTVNVDDSAIKLAANNTADSVDVGMYGKYVDGATAKYSGWFRDASDSGIIKWYTGSQTEPTQTVDTGATGYTLAQIDAIIDGGTY